MPLTLDYNRFHFLDVKFKTKDKKQQIFRTENERLIIDRCDSIRYAHMPYLIGRLKNSTFNRSRDKIVRMKNRKLEKSYGNSYA